jgi:hypothetical protein
VGVALGAAADLRECRTSQLLAAEGPGACADAATTPQAVTTSESATPVPSSTLRAAGWVTASVRPIRNTPIVSTAITASSEATFSLSCSLCWS